MDARQPAQTFDRKLRFDIYRTIVLGHYLRHWGLPEYRRVVTRANDDSIFEVYSFPSSAHKHVYHFATVGLAEQVKPDGAKEGHEYFMTLGGDLDGAGLDEVFEYLIDLCVHSVAHLGHGEPPRVLGPSALAPSAWATKALLIDEPRGEAEGFEQVNIAGSFDVEFLWLIPIHESEYRFILDEGIEAFDERENLSEYSIADVGRIPFC